MLPSGQAHGPVRLAVAVGLLVAGSVTAGNISAIDRAVPGSPLDTGGWGLLCSLGPGASPLPSWVVSVVPGWEFSPRPRVRRPRLPDRSKGGPVEIGGNRGRRFDYRDSFAEPWYREDATIDGASRLSWDPASSTIELRGSDEPRPVRLLYHFVSPYSVRDLLAELEGEIHGSRCDRIELALSADGERFGHCVGAFGRPEGNRFRLATNASTRFHTCGFWLRITGRLGPAGRVRLSAFRTTCRVKPPGRPTVALEPDDRQRLLYRDDFRSSKVLHLAEIDNGRALQWRRGKIFVNGDPHQGARVALRQKFVAPRPLRSIAVRVRNAADTRLGASNQFAISLDGHTLLATKATAPQPQGLVRGTTELRLDDPATLADARHFYLHIILANRAGKPDQTANAVSHLEVEARTAPAATTTAALPPRRPAAMH